MICTETIPCQTRYHELTISDNPSLEKFRLLMLEDCSEEPLAMITIKSFFKDVHKSKTRNLIWLPVNDEYHIDTVMLDLAT